MGLGSFGISSLVYRERPDRLMAAKGGFGEKTTPDSSIQDGKKRFGGLSIVFIRIQPVTGFSARVGNFRSWYFRIP
jgi:hypothetical protein